MGEQRNRSRTGTKMNEMKNTGANRVDTRGLEFRFLGEAVLQSGSDEGPPQFRMRAYTGAVVQIRGFEDPVIVDITGMEIPSQKIPIRKDHEGSLGVGHTTRIAIEGGELHAEGVISRDTASARDVTKSGRLGFPWQASIGGPATEVEYLGVNETEYVNGREVNGPMNIIRGMVLREISFVEYGADGATEATVQAIRKDDGMNDQVTEVEHGESKAVSMEESVPEAPMETEVSMKRETEESLTDSIARYRQGISAERNRIAAIEKVGNHVNPELELKAIENGWTCEQFELELLMKSTQLNETTPEGLAKPSTNPHAGKYEVVSSTYLSSNAFAGASSNAWYLLADPNRLPSLEVAFLGGVDRPTIERADADFSTMGIQFRGWLDFGVREQDYRGMLKVKGEA